MIHSRVAMRYGTKTALLAGSLLLLIHSLAALFTFIYAHRSNDGQAVFAYFWFSSLDAPTVLLEDRRPNKKRSPYEFQTTDGYSSPEPECYGTGQQAFPQNGRYV